MLRAKGLQRGLITIYLGRPAVRRMKSSLGHFGFLANAARRSSVRRRRRSILSTSQLLCEPIIFGCHFEIAFPQILRAELSNPATFLCPLRIRLSLQSLHIPMKRFGHWATPCCPNRQRRGRGRSGSYVNFAIPLFWKALVLSRAAGVAANKPPARSSQPSPQGGSTVEQGRGNAEPCGDGLPQS